jgi:hypothetical protein
MQIAVHGFWLVSVPYVMTQQRRSYRYLDLDQFFFLNISFDPEIRTRAKYNGAVRYLHGTTDKFLFWERKG